MGNAITLIVLLIILCGSAYGRRSMPYPMKGLDVATAVAPSASDGICKTLVEIHGYPCEEHTVIFLILIFSF